MRKLFQTVGITLLAMLVVAPFLWGQEPGVVTLNLSPQTFDISVNPGEKRQENFKIVNGSDSEVKLTAVAENFNVSGEEGGVSLTAEETNYSVADWISITPVEAVIEARGSQIFNFDINVPAAAEPGSHFGAIIVRSNNVQLAPTGPSVAQEIGPIILVKVAGDINEVAELASFGSTQAVWFTGPVELETRVQNEGNVHFKPRGSIVIKNMLGQEVTTLNLTEQNVLPDSVRKIVDEWDPGVFAFGRYTADLSLVYGGDATILTSSTSFFVFPLLMTLIVLGAIILLILVVRGRHRLAEAARVLSGR